MTRKVIVTHERGRVVFSYEDRKIPILNKEHNMTLNSLLGALRKHGRVAGQVYAISIEDVEAYLKENPELIAMLDGVDAEALALEIYDAIGAIGILGMVMQVILVAILEAAAPLEPERDDPMDGDHATALASAGFGTDEDYGCFGGDEEW